MVTKAELEQQVRDLSTQLYEKELQDQPPLGPLQPIWDAWESHRDYIDGLPNIYFRNVIEIQLNEIDDHVEAGNPPDKVENEIVDIISICMNWFRSRGFSDQDVVEAIQYRLPRFDDTQGIMDKYNERYGL